VVTSDGVVVIDTPQLPTKAVEMREEARAKGPLRFLVNTERHIDHIFGNHYFAGICPVVAHRWTREDFWTVPAGDPYTVSLDIVKKDDPEGLALMPSREDYVVNRPTVVFEEWMTLYLGNHTFHLIHTPGHTRGQIAVHIPEERVVFVGDTIFCQCQTWFHSADPDAWLSTLDFLARLDVDHIVPGHGPICTKDYLIIQSAFIREWLAAVALGIAQGWSKQECVERISFLDRYPVDIGQESAGPLVQERAVDRIFDFLTGKTERFTRPHFFDR